MPVLEDFKPDMNKAFNIFHNTIRSVNYNKDTGLMAVRIKWSDPLNAAKWANLYVSEFNKHIRTQAIEDVHHKLDFLREELERTDIVEMQKSIYRLIEAQTAMAMLANAKEDYSLEILDPAVPPVNKISPMRKKMMIMGFFFGLMSAVTFTIGAVIFNKFQIALKPYIKQ